MKLLIVYSFLYNFLDLPGPSKLYECNQNGRNINYHSPFFEPGLRWKRWIRWNKHCILIILFIFFCVILVQKNDEQIVFTVYFGYTQIISTNNFDYTQTKNKFKQQLLIGVKLKIIAENMFMLLIIFCKK